jgi:hypothetical protein
MPGSNSIITLRGEPCPFIRSFSILENCIARNKKDFYSVLLKLRGSERHNATGWRREENL